MGGFASLDVGSWKDPAWEDSVLKDALIEGPNDLLWMVEIKCGDEIVEPLLEAIDEIGLRSGADCSNFLYDDPLVRLKQLRPTIKATGFLS